LEWTAVSAGSKRGKQANIFDFGFSLTRCMNSMECFDFIVSISCACSVLVLKSFWRSFFCFL
jgi:hypothetical protein